VLTEPHPHAYPEADDDESWDLQFDGENVEEPVESERSIPFRAMEG
jgi:hypothetical protein